jgi:hypothetical protein
MGPKILVSMVDDIPKPKDLSLNTQEKRKDMVRRSRAGKSENKLNRLGE